MNKRWKKFTAVMAAALTFMSAAAFPVSAAGKIDPARGSTLTVHYEDSGAAIPEAVFSLHRVGSVDENGTLTADSSWTAYIKRDLNALTQADWADLASTLHGFVVRDRLTPAQTGKTDAAGEVKFSVKPGVYLVLGTRVTTEDFYTYTAVPFLVVIPGMEEGLNQWDYTEDVYPKFSKEYFPPEYEDLYVTRKVLKKWDDAGFETIRPEEVIVQLLCDGKVAETVTLNAGNNWRYAWDELEAAHEWLVVEKDLEQYAATVRLEGITFTVTNKYVQPITQGDPPVQKQITGDRPDVPEVFTFVFAANDVNYPMPAGSVGTVKEVHLTGAGSAEFGEITFTKPGTYVYTVREKAGNAEGYTYDPLIYTVTYEVELIDGELVSTRTITEANGMKAPTCLFTNNYKKPGNKLPETGELWWPVPLLICAGIACFALGLARRRRFDQ